MYTCPVADVKYQGSCPVINCPANIAHIPDRPSGCLYNFLQKPNYDRYTLAYALSTSNRVVDEKIKLGKEKIAKWLIFSVFLGRIHKPISTKCPKCSKPGKPCINIIRCNKRQMTIATILAQFPFNVDNIVQPVDLYNIIDNRTTLAILSKQYNMSMYDIIGIDRNAFTHLTQTLGNSHEPDSNP